ncbi:hypothetical protein D3C80_1837420 [compost metagenome]
MKYSASPRSRMTRSFMKSTSTCPSCTNRNSSPRCSLKVESLKSRGGLMIKGSRLRLPIWLASTA